MTPVSTRDDRPRPSSAPHPGSGVDTVTGAFSYSGRAIATALLDAGRTVRTLTGHPPRSSAASPIEVNPLDFDDPEGLRRSLEGTTTLYNTYWVRFAHDRTDHERAAANSRTLFRAAERAGVQRIVHVSITNPSLDSPYPYFRGKAVVEQSLVDTGVSHAVLRPAILFGGDGVLVNNIAWLLRHLPVFAVGGRGDYRIRGVHVDDLARLCSDAGTRSDDYVIDAVGPEAPTFLELVQTIREAVGSRARIIGVPSAAVPPIARLLGLVMHDVLLTPDEYGAMASGLAHTEGPATGTTRLSAWVAEHGESLGLRYANELDRHFRPAER
jgi:nucleoside-diphosphate-sugar epimerase